MTYRVRRKFTSSTFYIDDQICKIWFDPEKNIERVIGFGRLGLLLENLNAN